MSDTSAATTLASIRVREAPVGRIFDFSDPDNSTEDEYFSGWELPLTPHRYWKRLSPFILDREGGRTVLECERNVAAMMITGNEDWTDYTIQSRVRLLHRRSNAGLLARYQTSRHYYLLNLELPGRLVLMCRDNCDWHELAVLEMDIDRTRYYQLGLTVKGNRLTASIDGDETFSVVDENYAGGRSGISTTLRTRFDGVEILSDPAGISKTDGRRAARLTKQKNIQDQYPQERLCAQYQLPAWEQEAVGFSRLGPGGSWGCLLFSKDCVFSSEFAKVYAGDSPPRVGVSDLDGNLIWGSDRHLRFPQAIDVNGDGREEIVAIHDDKTIVTLSPETGEIINEAPLPESCPYQGARGQVIAPDLYPWTAVDLTGTGVRSEIVINDDRQSRGGRTLWAYDGDLNPLWTATVGHPRYGHTLSACDINGDGRDEILAGFHLFDADGKLIWNCREAEFNADDHVDEVQVGLFGPNGEPRACGTNGDDGFYIMDGSNGEVITKHLAGHVQGCSVGNYLHDRPGKDYVVGVRWGNFGVLTTLDSLGEHVKFWQPDAVSQGGPAVRWTGDGRDLVFLSTTEEAFGLWDGYGNRCVRLECPELPNRGFYGISGGRPYVFDIDDDGCDELVICYDDQVLVYEAGS